MTVDFDILKRKELRAAARLVGRAFEDYELFTNSDKNIAFYKRCGFEVFDEREFTNNGKTMRSWSVKKTLLTMKKDMND
jgi:hypothetical protein